ECHPHGGRWRIHLERIDEHDSVQPAPQVCMHCKNPICARVCPADAIKQTAEGVTQSALKPRCIGCQNCVLACPFGVPNYYGAIDQMMKCDLCYDRTSSGKRPMGATVCPSQALAFTTLEQIELSRRGRAINRWVFGDEAVETKVFVLVPPQTREVRPDLVQLGGRRHEAFDVAVLLEGAA